MQYAKMNLKQFMSGCAQNCEYTTVIDFSIRSLCDN